MIRFPARLLELTAPRRARIAWEREERQRQERSRHLCRANDDARRTAALEALNDPARFAARERQRAAEREALDALIAKREEARVQRQLADDRAKREAEEARAREIAETEHRELKALERATAIREAADRRRLQREADRKAAFERLLETADERLL